MRDVRSKENSLFKFYIKTHFIRKRKNYTSRNAHLTPFLVDYNFWVEKNSKKTILWYILKEPN